MTVSVGDTIRATARLKWAGAVDVQNVFTCQLATGTTVDDEDAKEDLAAYLEAMYGLINPVFPTNLAYIDIDYFNLSTDTPMGQLAWPVLTAGSSGDTEISASGVCLVTTAFSFIVRKHGRKFWGPLSEAAITAGEITSVLMITAGTLLATWLTPFAGVTSGETWRPGIWSRAESVFHVFRDAVCRNVPGYQRRRRAGVGS
jgi:hypothetical protein